MPEAQILKSKEYETIYILRSDVDADTADRVQARVAEVVGRDNGKLVKVESWGRRKLAYPVAKQRKNAEVDVAAVTVDPEEIKFQRLELEAEPDEAESREKQLGLIDLGPDAPRSMRGDRGGDDEYGDAYADGGEAGRTEGEETPASVKVEDKADGEGS